jgi:naphthalene 1,2-dioxygenase system ferredoxin subunit
VTVFSKGAKLSAPLHQGKFDVCSGQALCVPLTENIKTYAVRIENMRVMLKLD